jgi:DNA replication protein DnaC
MDDRHASLQGILRELHLTTMAGVCSDLALKAAREGLSHEAYLLELARLEGEARAQRRRDRRLAESGLPREKTLATLQLERFPAPIRLHIERIRRGEWIDQATNIITIGPPGTGKSHLLAGVGHAMVDRGHTVLWTPTATLVQRLLAAKRDLRLPRELARLDRIACLILDDIGYVEQSREEMEVLFTLLAARYERRSVLISSNLVFSQWPTIFKDPMTTAAALDRVLHHAILLDLSGMTSYRVATGSSSPSHDQSEKLATTLAAS